MKISVSLCRKILGIKHRSKKKIFLLGVSVCFGSAFLYVYPHAKKPHTYSAESILEDTESVLHDNLKWLSSRSLKNNLLRQRRASLINKENDGWRITRNLPKAVKKDITDKSLRSPTEIFQRDIKESNTDPRQHSVIAHSHKSYMLAAGEMIQATLESAVNTDLAGAVRAIVSRPVYAYTGRHVVIPAGSRLLGEYQKVMHEQQQRIWIRWSRVLLPNGSSVRLDSPSTDGLGRSGLHADQVNNHAWLRFRNASFLSLLSGATLLSGGLDASTETAAQTFRSTMSDQFAQAAENSWVSRSSVRPTAVLYPGHQVIIYVMHDVDCSSFVNLAGKP